MAYALPLLLLLVLCSATSPTADAGAGVDDELNFVVVATGSLRPKAVCSGLRVISPSPNFANWVPLHPPHGPCSATDTDTSTPPSVLQVLLWDEHRADYIQRKLSGDHAPLNESAASNSPPAPADETDMYGQQYAVKYKYGTAKRKKKGTHSEASLALVPTATGGRENLPGVVQTVVLDTASDVPWVQCAPCPIPQCYPQTDVLYDPSQSPSSAAFSCSSPTCTQLGPYANGCSSNNQCQYRVQYPDGSSTMGTYISDVLTMSATSVVSKFQFGCSHAEVGSFDRRTAGILSLGGGPESLVSQTKATYGQVFSYCFPPTPSYHGFFILGVPGHSSSRYVVTPLLKNLRVPPTFYMVRLQAITVAGQSLNVPPTVFAAGSVLDSRTAITRLPPTAYQALRTAFRNNMMMYRPASPKGFLDTCFDFRGVRNIRLPRIQLVFDRNAAVELDPSGILFSDCLAFAANGDDRFYGIIGNVQQHTIEVLYNGGGGSVGFRRGAC